MITSVVANKPLWSLRTTCRLCGSAKIRQVVELPPMAVATPNFHLRDVPLDHRVYREPVPMPLHLCGHCGFLQIVYIGNPEIQYRDYAYTTNLSLGLPDHFVRSADHLVEKLGLRPGARVFEFGSNDGTYLRAFQACGFSVVGADPARSVAKRASAAGIPTYPDFFGTRLATIARKENGPADLIVANNVIANIDDLADIFRGVAVLLAEDGAFVFETQYGLDVTEKYLLDTIYHEHLSYFNVAPLTRSLEQFGLSLFDVERIPTKGGSIRVFVQHVKGHWPITKAVTTLVAEEARLECETDPYFKRFAAGSAEIRNAVVAAVDHIRREGGAVAGYGVSVGTSTLLGQLGLIGKIDFLVDDDREKPPILAGPGYDIPVYHSSELTARRPVLTVVFAWRYLDAIVSRNAAYREAGGKFLVPLPKIRLI
jgi:SAM-dependent methyltransferase